MPSMLKAFEALNKLLVKYKTIVTWLYNTMRRLTIIILMISDAIPTFLPKSILNFFLNIKVLCPPIDPLFFFQDEILKN